MRLRNELKSLGICNLRTKKLNLRAHLCLFHFYKAIGFSNLTTLPWLSFLPHFHTNQSMYLSFDRCDGLGGKGGRVEGGWGDGRGMTLSGTDQETTHHILSAAHLIDRLTWPFSCPGVLSHCTVTPLSFSSTLLLYYYAACINSLSSPRSHMQLVEIAFPVGGIPFLYTVTMLLCSL